MSNDEADAITEFYDRKWQKEERSRFISRMEHKLNSKRSRL
jgi:hypothetical protein